MNNWQQQASLQEKYGNSIVENSEPTLRFKARQSFNTRSNVTDFSNNKQNQRNESGHMTFLRKLQESEREVLVITSLGEVIRGFVKAVDDQTISLKSPNKDAKDDSYRTRVLFKSQIVEFSPIKGIEELADKLEKQGRVNGWRHGGTSMINC